MVSSKNEVAEKIVIAKKKRVQKLAYKHASGLYKLKLKRLFLIGKVNFCS